MHALKRTLIAAIGLLFIAMSTTTEAGTVTLAWDPPATGTPAGYAVAWGSQSGVYTDYVDVGKATSHTLTNLVDGQTYYFAAFSYDASGPSAPSNELVHVGGCATAPAAPSGLTGDVASSTVSLRWQAPVGEAPTGYRVQVGSRPGITDLANLFVTTTALSGTASAGTYYVRVLSENLCGASPVSNEISVTVGGGAGGKKKAPGSPRNPKRQVFNSAVTLSWEAPSTGDAPERYFIEVTDKHGAPLANVDTGSPITEVSGHVPPGTYNVRIRGANSGGVGPPTATLTVIVTP